MFRIRPSYALLLAIGSGSTILPAAAGEIGTAIVNGQGVFVRNGALFSPRGLNFVRLLPHTTAAGTSVNYNAIFDPGSYNSADVTGELHYIASSGYNVVRANISSLFANGGYGLSMPGIDPTYLANLRNFLELADADGLQVILTADALPTNYDVYLRQPTGTETAKIAGPNVPVLDPAFAIGMARYWSDILGALAQTSATALHAVMAVEVLNEAYVSSNCAPFTANRCVTLNGVLSPAPGSPIETIEVDGTVYDLGVDGDRQNLVDAATFNLIGTVRAAVRAVDSSILVSMGAFTIWEGDRPGASFDGVHGETASIKERYPVRPFMIGRYSEADFVDLHVYPSPGAWSLTNELAADEIGPTTILAKPLLMGEYGVARPTFPTLASAISVLSTFPTEACAFGFSGWLLWMWDATLPTENAWTAKAGGGAVNGVVSPNARPVICPPIPRSLFRVSSEVGYSNGATYCLFSSWEDYVTDTKRESLSGLASYARLPGLMPYSGRC